MNASVICISYSCPPGSVGCEAPCVYFLKKVVSYKNVHVYSGKSKEHPLYIIIGVLYLRGKILIVKVSFGINKMSFIRD